MKISLVLRVALILIFGLISGNRSEDKTVNVEAEVAKVISEYANNLAEKFSQNQIPIGDITSPTHNAKQGVLKNLSGIKVDSSSMKPNLNASNGSNRRLHFFAGYENALLSYKNYTNLGAKDNESYWSKIKGFFNRSPKTLDLYLHSLTFYVSVPMTFEEKSCKIENCAVTTALVGNAYLYNLSKFERAFGIVVDKAVIEPVRKEIQDSLCSFIEKANKCEIFRST